MMSLNPLLLVGGVIGTVSVLLLIAYACVCMNLLLYRQENGYGLRAQHGRR